MIERPDIYVLSEREAPVVDHTYLAYPQEKHTLHFDFAASERATDMLTFNSNTLGAIVDKSMMSWDEPSFGGKQRPPVKGSQQFKKFFK